MINGATVNSFAVNGANRQLILAFAEVEFSVDVTTSAFDIIPAIADIQLSFETEADGIRWPLAFTDVEIEFDTKASPFQNFSGEAFVSFEITLQPSSEFSVFAHIITEFSGEFTANAVPADANLSIEIDIDSPSSTKNIPAKVDTSITIEIEHADFQRFAEALAEIETVFRCFFAPDFENIRYSSAEFEFSFPVEASGIASPRLSEFVFSFEPEIFPTAVRAVFAEFSVDFISEVVGTIVHPSIAELSLEFYGAAESTIIIPAFVDFNVLFNVESESFHEAFAAVECEMSLELYSFANYYLHVFADIVTQFMVEPDSITIFAAEANTIFEIVAELDEELIILAEQGIVDFRANFIISAICHLLFLAYSDVDLEIDISLADGIIGAYVPAAECRTIYVEPDFNELFVPAEERELRIAC